MEEILDNFELGIDIDEKQDPEEMKQAIDLCIAKLQALVATNKITTDGNNLEPINSESYDEAACLTIVQEELYSSSLYETALQKLFGSNDPQYREYKKIFRYLLFQLQRNDNEIHHLEEDVDSMTYEIIEAKMALKRVENELTKSRALIKSKQDNKDDPKEKYRSKTKNINNWQCLIREIIILSEQPLTGNRNLVEILKKYRKPFRPDL